MVDKNAGKESHNLIENAVRDLVQIMGIREELCG